MDKVQVYYTVLLTAGVFLSGFLHGKSREAGEYNAVTDMIALVINLPVIGRIYGWW